jgi:Protein of unknown function (DUF4019)
MKNWVKMGLALCFTVFLASKSICAIQPQNAPTAERVAIRSSEDWLVLVDSGRYPESWKNAAAAFRSVVTQEKWESAMKTTREPSGKLLTRRLDSAKYTTLLPGVPAGDYVVLLFESSFEHKAVAQETVIVSLEKDKVWRVAGYYIK